MTVISKEVELITFHHLGTGQTSLLLPKPLRDCPKSDLPGNIALGLKNHRRYDILAHIYNKSPRICCRGDLYFALGYFYFLFVNFDLLNLHLNNYYLYQISCDLNISHLLLMICNLQVSFPPNPSVAQRRGALLRTRTSMWPHMMISIHDHWSDDHICMMIIVKHICSADSATVFSLASGSQHYWIQLPLGEDEPVS